MSSGLIRVTPDQLAGVAGRLRGGAAGIDGTLTQLAADVAPLGTDWAGPAQTRFLQLWEQWRTRSPRPSPTTSAPRRAPSRGAGVRDRAGRRPAEAAGGQPAPR